MVISYLKVLWTIIHFLVSLVELGYNFGLEFREKSRNFVNFIQNIGRSKRYHDYRDDKLLIERRLVEIRKYPRHLAVILNVNKREDIDVSQLISLTIWAMSSGTNFISFYDYKGIVKHELSSEFHKTIEQHVNRSEGENIVWGPNFQTSSGAAIKYPHRNGYKKHIVVNLYSSDDGHASFNQLLTQELCAKDDVACAYTQISQDFIDEKLGNLFGHLPDPDLAVYFGGTFCTSGFNPWKIRLTEFIQISYKLKQLSLEKFLKVLCKYAKCEQRFGA